MTFIRTTAINKILALAKPIKGIQGGTSAGKTYGILPIEIDYAAKHPGTETSVVAESFPHLRRGAMKDFKKIMQETGRWVESRWNITDSTYRFANGSSIEFFSADSSEKLRGGRRDRLYMNEANNMQFNVYTELASRTKGSVTMDWNPTESFWFHDELMGDKDVDYLVINYLDNEACPEAALNFILKAKEKATTSAFWDNWYRVYGLGEVGTLEGVIFTNWQQVAEIPKDAELVAYGLDWGFTNDPTTIVAVYRYNGMLYLDELLYQTGLVNSAIIAQLPGLGVERNTCIVADSAEPKSITDVSNAGYYIESAKKGPDSIRSGIDVLQQHTMMVTNRSLNLIKELRSYRWATDKAGKALNEPVKVFNHAIDALRYVALNKLSLFQGSGHYAIGEA